MKKRGFTLIELLAVIAILAVIALIAVPIILNMIESARRGAAVDSAYGYIKAVETYVADKDLELEQNDLIYGENSVEQINNVISIKGKAPTSGNVTIDESNSVTKAENLCIFDYSVQYESNKAYIKGKCGTNEEEKPNDDTKEETEEIITDIVPCELASETIENKEYLYIDSVEDMYAFSKSITSENTYEGKIVKLRNNLDFSTYKPEIISNVCETNDNQQGFLPIGTQSAHFKGTFDGGAKTISNLTINRPTENYVGIFGYVDGATIYGLTLEHINITGNNYVGGLIGYSNNGTTEETITNVKEIVLKDVNVTGNDRVAGIMGYNYNSSYINNIIYKKGDIQGNSYVSSLNYGSAPRNSIIEKVNVKGESESSTRLLYEYAINNSYNTYYSELSTDNEEVGQYAFKASNINDINFYEAAGLDTWIGGDNNETGYYFDYSGNEIVLKSLEKDPITFTLKGEGTEINPYLISNTKEWKEVSGNPDTESYYKLVNDIDFSTDKFYMLASDYNLFNGTLDGNIKTIKNVTLDITHENCIGIFGYANGANIYGLNLEHINITGNNFTGGLIGYSIESTVKEVVLNDVNIAGNDKVAGIIGYNYNTSSDINNIIYKKGSIKGESYVSSLNYGSAPTNSIIEKVSITGPSSSSYLLYSYSIANDKNTYYSELSTENEVVGQYAFKASNINDINFYEAAGLDTWIGGDNNSTGYYFDYSGNEIVLKSIEKDPITFTLKGEGTEANPYLISNTKEWKEVSGRPNTGSYYKLTNDIDFSTDKFYMLASDYNLFNGILDGNIKTIKNVTLDITHENCIGIFGYANGATIYGLNLENINITGNNFTGGLIGYSIKSTVKEVVLNDVNIIGNDKVAGIMGYNYNTSSDINNIIYKKGNIEGKSYVSTINYGSAPKNSIIEKVSITGPSSSSYLLYNSSIDNSSNTYYSESSTENEVVGQYAFKASNINDINFYEAAGLDTWIGGDNNSTGYYFDYSGNEIVLKSIEKDPITFTLKGEGTETNPYLISNTKEWKEVSGRPNTGSYYKLTNDIDFSTDKFYMLASDYNLFNGILDGNIKTIKNVTLDITHENCIGIFGYANGANIYGLNLENINITGNDYVGGLIGYSIKSTVKEVVLKEVNVTGNDDVAGIMGENYNSASYINNILYKKGSIEGKSYVSSITYGSTPRNSILEKVSITGPSSSSYLLYSSSEDNSYKTYYSNSSTENGEVGSNGFPSLNIDDIDYYTWILETRIEGDTNGTGYYFDYIYSKGEVGLVNVNDTTNKPPFEATEENKSNGTCTADYGDWISTCAPYTSGIHGGYAYKKADDASSTTGAACSSIISNVSYYPVYRAKVTYTCN